jgi:hypothetical protein
VGLAHAAEADDTESDFVHEEKEAGFTEKTGRKLFGRRAARRAVCWLIFLNGSVAERPFKVPAEKALAYGDGMRLVQPSLFGL